MIAPDDKTPEAHEDLTIKRIGAFKEVSPFVKPREASSEVILQRVGKNLLRRDYAVSIASTLKDAADLVMTSILPESGAKTVSFGGSMTVRQAGLLEALKARPELTVLDTFDASIGAGPMLELRRQALLCDLFLCSVNAMTRDGELLLVDGLGNRTAAVQYGPRKVVLLVGRNKICASRASAEEYIKGIAAPSNATRLSKNTPCVKTGYCMDCNSPERICAYWTILQLCRPQAGRIHVILIDEEVGF